VVRACKPYIRWSVRWIISNSRLKILDRSLKIFRSAPVPIQVIALQIGELNFRIHGTRIRQSDALGRGQCELDPMRNGESDLTL
jgi:hypothetical protein